MSNEDMIRMNIELLVAPEHEEQVRTMLQDDSDICFLLDVERLAGAHLEGPKIDILRQFRSEVSRGGFDYGMDVIEADSDERRI